MEREEELDSIPWQWLKDVAGSAGWVPGSIRGLYDPEAPIDDCCWGLQDLAYLGSRFSATAPAAPFLVDAVRDSPVLSPRQREGLLFTIWMCALGIPEERLDWRHQRNLQEQEGPHAVAAWNAVTACHPALREFLSEPGREVVFAALRVLVWTGDMSEPVMNTISEAIYSPDSQDVCDGWLAAVALGQLPPDVDIPAGPTAKDPRSRFGEAAAALRFAGSAARREAVDELWQSFGGYPPFEGTGQFRIVLLPEHASTWVLSSETPDHLRPYASDLLLNSIRQGDGYSDRELEAYLRLNLRHVPRPLTPDGLDAYARNALIDLLPLLPRFTGRIVGDDTDQLIWTLKEQGLPDTPAALAHWLGQEPPAAG